MPSSRRDSQRLYVNRQRHRGIPDRRLVSDCLLIETITAASQKAAVTPKELLRLSGLRILAMQTAKGEQIFSKDGTIYRIRRIADEVLCPRSHR